MKFRLLLTILSAVSACYAQGGFGSISGRVTDPSGAAVPGARIETVNVDTKIATAALSTEQGYYQLLQLPLGVYNIQASGAGFKTISQNAIRVQVSDRLTLDFAMTIGNLSESITVEAEAQALRTADAQLGEVITNTMIRNLPQYNRDPMQLLVLSGNVQGGG
ncbi:MAG: carboxypeptidase-like regulatory domain-containing protein, partial [Bryobacteraceae bacterium]|nr:carboxypeptidase-like regulatory domain-containing protein [Bryobacteraceae bacterium]